MAFAFLVWLMAHPRGRNWFLGGEEAAYFSYYKAQIQQEHIYMHLWWWNLMGRDRAGKKHLKRPRREQWGRGLALATRRVSCPNHPVPTTAPYPLPPSTLRGPCVSEGKLRPRGNTQVCRASGQES